MVHIVYLADVLYSVYTTLNSINFAQHVYDIKLLC